MSLGVALVTAFLIALCFEVMREAYGLGVPANVRAWSVKHYERMTKFPRPEFDWWAERKSRSELQEHQRRWHIDLLAKQREREEGKTKR